MQGPWEAMLTPSEDAQQKDARQNLRMQGYPWESCSSLLCGLTVERAGGPACRLRLQLQVGVLARGRRCCFSLSLAWGHADSERPTTERALWCTSLLLRYLYINISTGRTCDYPSYNSMLHVLGRISATTARIACRVLPGAVDVANVRVRSRLQSHSS